MTHRHFCDFAGHDWDCKGSATRLLAAEPTLCMCLNHGVPMEKGDHSACSVELLSCPDHRDDQMRAMGYEPGHIIEQPSPMFRDEEGNQIIGFCLWCNKEFYTMEEHEAYIAGNMAACSVFQALKDEHNMPPVLEAMLEEHSADDESQTVQNLQNTERPAASVQIESRSALRE